MAGSRKNTTIAITRELYSYLTKQQKKLCEQRGRYVPYSDVIAFLIGKQISDIADSYKREQERLQKEYERLEQLKEKLKTKKYCSKHHVKLNIDGECGLCEWEKRGGF